ncbi:unnamed protein product [Brassica rapa]|uniref:Pollen Ole e 1 allergen and extensin family protein n=2 Tax=Brassica TaxID=3705 RepID=A0A3P6CQ06_BRACM|nr:uncharacterized protein LOC106448963 [Brassica napus]CAF2298959.1 unnamed protein product [Brassica napus]CAG7908376.1 unnamed protein product [Brassica rapa]VDD15758.1 unnamed protein product [Brassica rapa]
MLKPNVFLLYMFLIIASLYSISHSLSLLGFQINIRGIVRCSLTGDPNAPPVSGSVVNLVCANETTNLSGVLTDPTGAFNFTLKFSDTLLYDPSYCVVEANLPAGNCSLSPPNGTLTATVNLVNVFVTSALVTLNYITGPFVQN